MAYETKGSVVIRKNGMETITIGVVAVYNISIVTGATNLPALG